MGDFEDLAVLALLLDEEEQQRPPPKRKRKWVETDSRHTNNEAFNKTFEELAKDEQKFYENFGMSENTFNILLSRIENDVQKQDTVFRMSISPRQRLAVTLRQEKLTFLVTGDSQRAISTSFHLGTSTVHHIVQDTCHALVKRMMPEALPPPSKETWQQIAREFQNVWDFPNCLGALDGRNIYINAPSNADPKLKDEHNRFTIDFIGLVDAHYNFIAVEVGTFRNFAQSYLGQAFDACTLPTPGDDPLPGTNNAVPYVMLGDEGFPLKPYLLRPYPDRRGQEDLAKKTFNYRLRDARRVAEDVFNFLNQKFKIFNRKITMHADKAEQIVLATSILYNFVKKHEGMGGIADMLEALPASMKAKKKKDKYWTMGLMPRVNGTATQEARVVREFYKAFFISRGEHSLSVGADMENDENDNDEQQ